MKIKITENQLKNIVEQISLPKSPGRRFYRELLKKGYLDRTTPVNVYTDTLEIYKLPEGAPNEFFEETDGYVIVVVPYLFEDEGVEIQFESDVDDYYEELYREKLKEYISDNWSFDFPYDFDDEYLY